MATEEKKDLLYLLNRRRVDAEAELVSLFYVTTLSSQRLPVTEGRWPQLNKLHTPSFIYES